MLGFSALSVTPLSSLPGLEEEVEVPVAITGGGWGAVRISGTEKKKRKRQNLRALDDAILHVLDELEAVEVETVEIDEPEQTIPPVIPVRIEPIAIPQFDPAQLAIMQREIETLRAYVQQERANAQYRAHVARLIAQYEQEMADDEDDLEFLMMAA